MQERRIRILFATVFADQDNVNSQCLSSRDLALHLDPQRFVSTFFFQRQADRRLKNQSHIQLHQLPARLGSLPVIRQMVWGQHDILYYVLPGRIASAYWALRGLGRRKKVVSTVEGTADQVAATPAAYQRRYLAGLRRSDRVHGLTDQIHQSMAETFGLSLDLPSIPLGVDLKRFPPVDRQPHKPPWKVLFVGSVQPRKQPHLILDLARKLGYREVEFHLVGGPLGHQDYYESLQETCRREGLRQIVFHGALEPDQVFEQMQKADLFLLPSHHEGLPRVTVEAAATGLPCLVFETYRTPSVVDGVTGFQVADFDGMLDRLQELLRNREKRLQMGEAASQHAKNFSWANIAQTWMQIFEELAGRRA